MIGENELEVIIDVGFTFVNHSQSIAVLKLKFHRVWVDYSRRDRKIVNQQMHKIFMFDSL